jgi:hypothetical protein
MDESASFSYWNVVKGRAWRNNPYPNVHYNNC